MESNWRQIQVQLRLGLSGSRDWEQHVKSWADEVKALRKELDAALEQSNRRQGGCSLRIHDTIYYIM